MSKRVLIIDDDHQTLHLLQAAISSLEVDIFTTDDGITGLECAKNITPDLVIMDMLLPERGMRGWDAIRAFKHHNDLGHVPIIAITAGVPEYMDRAITAGADECLQKPFSLEQLRTMILSYLAN